MRWEVDAHEIEVMGELSNISLLLMFATFMVHRLDTILFFFEIHLHFCSLCLQSG